MLKISAVICLICLCYTDALPHCKVVDLPEGIIQRNTINVIYTMESSCKNCARKALMLPKLKASFKNAGINAHFIVAVSHKSTRLSGLSSHLTINQRHLWKALGEQNNHFYIIDRCGRMVYEIINPWSSIQMPFLRGAVAATQFSHPCGLCPQDYSEVTEENLKIYPEIVEEAHSHTEEAPLGIVMRVRHKHHRDPNVYNYIVMTANGKPGHHRHLPHETKNKINHKSSFSLNIPVGNDQAYETSSIPTHAVSDSSVNEKQLSVEYSINSIKNLANNSQRMANETQLSLSSSDTEENPLVSSTPSDIKNNHLVSSMSSDTKNNPLVTSTPSDIIDNLLVSSTPSDTKDNPLVNSVTNAPSDTTTEINYTERSNQLEKSQEIDNFSEEFVQELDSSYSDTDEETSDDGYDEDSQALQNEQENSQISSSELAEKIYLKEHYGRILDWIKYPQENSETM
ncbi:uncharacterized protein [Halyomorpha halys]|uniref:uncharacterized protein n=1 Tax=Halyomorpha halys TaxID=286706 RepID=UPI0006D51E7A|nr:uncharacterized protein LOC106685596 [Halyomorpha halys]